MQYGKINIVLLSIMIVVVFVVLFQINSINTRLNKLVITGNVVEEENKNNEAETVAQLICK